MERLPAYITIEDNKYKKCIILTTNNFSIQMPERIGVLTKPPKNGYVYFERNSLKFVYVKGWLYDCNNKIEPINIGTSNSAEQVTKLWEAMKCL